MLNKNNERELAYLVTVDDIQPIGGRDKVESAVVGGWTCMVPKEQFKPGDVGIYFEIDSLVPQREPFLFLAKRHWAVKTQRFKTPDGHYFSQGLLMHPSDFEWVKCPLTGNFIDKAGKTHNVNDESRFVTQDLGITYYVPEDNTRKARSADKYVKMQARHRKLFKNPFIKWVMKFKLGRKVMFFFFGKKKDKTNAWPSFVKKTDEERIQNCAYILQNTTDKFIATEKLDGSSTTFAIKRGKKANDFWVCSRNVAFIKDKKEDCFYQTNPYLEMAEKYHAEQVLNRLLDEFPDEEWIYIQGETYGDGVQKRNYSMTNGEKDFKAFNLVFSTTGREGSIMASQLLEHYGIPWVPILDTDFTLPATVEEMLEYAGSVKSVIDDGMREGVVIRSSSGTISFKAVDNEFLMKYHG